MDYEQAGKTAAYHTIVNVARRTDAANAIVFFRAYVAVLMTEMAKLNEELKELASVPEAPRKFAVINGGRA